MPCRCSFFEDGIDRLSGVGGKAMEHVESALQTIHASRNLADAVPGLPVCALVESRNREI